MNRLAFWDNTSPKSLLFFIVIALFFTINLISAAISYERLKAFDYAYLEAKLISCKERKNKDGVAYFSLFFRSRQMDFRGYGDQNLKNLEGSRVGVIIKTSSLGFIDMFKTPKVKLQSIKPLNTQNALQPIVKNFISSQHQNEYAKEVYLNLFLNVETGSDVEDFVNVYGLGAFFAISGLNAALLGALIFATLSPPFKLVQDRFFPYVNRRFWIGLFTFFFLSAYAYLTDFTPSFARALVAYLVFFYFMIITTKVASYKSLAISALACVGVAPSLIFSIGFWLSVYGVFLIFLFLDNAPLKNRVALYFALSAWLSVATTPVIHFIFAIFTNAHLLNALFSVAFDIFYPVTFCAHLAGFGDILDEPIVYAVTSAKDISKKEFFTPVWFFAPYIVSSIVAAFYREWFVYFNFIIGSYVAAMLWFIF